MKTNLELPDNVRLYFTDKGLFISTSLNVKKEVALVLPKENVRKGMKHTVYVLRSRKPVRNNINEIYREYLSLLNQAMLDVRNAKKLVLDIEIKRIKQRAEQLSLF